MSWQVAREKLLRNIYIGLKLDENPLTAYKIVTKIPDKSGTFYLVQIGKTNYLKVPVSMLEVVFNAIMTNKNFYDKSVLDSIYPKVICNRPCAVHTIGRLFEKAHIMKKISARQYYIHYNNS